MIVPATPAHDQAASGPGPAPVTFGHPGDPEPRRYRQIARVIRQRMEEGEIKPGDTVRITALAQEFTVASETATRALAALADDGWLRHYPGHGYVATAHGRARQGPGMSGSGPAPVTFGAADDT